MADIFKLKYYLHMFFPRSNGNNYDFLLFNSPPSLLSFQFKNSHLLHNNYSKTMPSKIFITLSPNILMNMPSIIFLGIVLVSSSKHLAIIHSILGLVSLYKTFHTLYTLSCKPIITGIKEEIKRMKKGKKDKGEEIKKR